MHDWFEIGDLQLRKLADKVSNMQLTGQCLIGLGVFLLSKLPGAFCGLMALALNVELV